MDPRNVTTGEWRVHLNILIYRCLLAILAKWSTTALVLQAQFWIRNEHAHMLSSKRIHHHSQNYQFLCLFKWFNSIFLTRMDEWFNFDAFSKFMSCANATNLFYLLPTFLLVITSSYARAFFVLGYHFYLHFRLIAARYSTLNTLLASDFLTRLHSRGQEVVDKVLK